MDEDVVAFPRSVTCSYQSYLELNLKIKIQFCWFSKLSYRLGETRTPNLSQNSSSRKERRQVDTSDKVRNLVCRSPS